MTTTFILAVILISLYDGLPLIKKRQWPELIAVGLIIGTSALLTIAEFLKLTTPFNWLEQLLMPIGVMLFR
jgi:hypothetical protein